MPTAPVGPYVTAPIPALVEAFHDAGGGFVTDPAARAPGPDRERRSYATYATLLDPDGNGWMLQELTTRLPGRA